MSRSANSLYQQVQALQPWELIHQLEQEKLDVRGNETQLRVRLLSRQLERAYPSIPMPSCEIGREEEWLEFARQFEGSIEKISSFNDYKERFFAEIYGKSIMDEMTKFTCTQRELVTELKSTHQTMVEMMTEIKTLREELAENSKRMESLEAAVIQKENQESEEDGIAYRAKCSQLMQIWKNREARQSPKEFLQDLKDFRKFARMSDRVLFELLLFASPCWVRNFCRNKTFDTWELFEEEFHQNFREKFHHAFG